MKTMTVKCILRDRAWCPGNEGGKAVLRIGKITLREVSGQCPTARK